MRPKSTTSRAAANGAFTLVELLVVIAIILLLAGILVPTVASALKMGHKMKCVARIRELADGCYQYHQAHDYYPGQEKPQELPGGSDQHWDSGAELLARAMFTKDNQWPTSNYAQYKQSDLLTTGDGASYKDTIWDCFPKQKMPMLYYPSRGKGGGCSQYRVQDNAAITGTWSQNDFESFILDSGFDASDMPYMDGEFLIISAGVNRQFLDPDGSDDNLVNWNK